MPIDIEFELSFLGNDSDNHKIDLYDVSTALVGFQRTLALTTHLVLNNEIITQAPSLKNARILTSPTENGSWKIRATVIMAVAGGYTLLTSPKDSPIGYLVSSAFDYVIHQSLGFHVDYNSTIGRQLEELQQKKLHKPNLSEERLDSLIEKCEAPILQLHRPIFASRSASSAIITSYVNQRPDKIQTLTDETYAYLRDENTEDTPQFVFGKISSYNINTFKGRIYDLKNQRPIPFLLDTSCRDNKSVSIISGSLNANALDRDGYSSLVKLRVFRHLSITGRIKSYFVNFVSVPTDLELRQILLDNENFQ